MERYNAETSKMNIMSGAKIENNVMVRDDESYYSDWRDEDMNVLQALREDKLLPTDKRIIISLPLMFLILAGYSLAFYFASGTRDMTAFTISVQILVIFLCFIPVKRYFSTFENPGVGGIVSFVLGFILNYVFGVLSYVLKWNDSPAYTCLWTVVNIFLLSAYAAYDMLRDKGLTVPTVIICAVSIVLSFGAGIILIVMFSLTPVGLGFMGAAFFYSYAIILYLIYLKMNNSIPFAFYPITLGIIIVACFGVMIYAFVVDTFDNFYGFSVTYLVINLLILLYGIWLLYGDMMSRFDRPNFYSAYGSPIYKYDNSLKSVIENMKSLKVWLAAWFMFYSYTLLMEIFIADTNYGIAAQQIFLIVFFLTFIYFVTYNVYRSGTIKKDIKDNIIEESWKEVLKIKEETVSNYLDIEEIERTLDDLYKKRENDEDVPSGVKINPKKDESKNEQMETESAIDDGEDINLVIYEMEDKLEKAKQNDKILLVNLWAKILFRC